MKSIDLHGLIEQEAISATLNAFMSLVDGEELEIITGNGCVIKDVVLELVEEEGFKHRHDNSNFGSIIVWI